MTNAIEAPLPKNTPATVALVAGLLSWIPGVGLVGIVAGLIGAQRARLLGGSGRGKAAVGVVAGIAGLFLWAVLIGAIFQGRALQKAVPAFNATKKFVMLVGSGQVAAAQKLCTDAITIDRLTDTAEQFQQWGGFNGDVSGYAGEPLPDGVRVEYKLPFEKSTQILAADWVFVDGQPRLKDYRLSAAPDDKATTQTTPAGR